MLVDSQKQIIVGIDATRNRSGGAVGHLRGILTHSDPREYGIKEVHLWAYGQLLNKIPNQSWIIKHNPPEVEKGLIHSVWWQFARLKKEAQCQNCDIMLNTDAGTVSRFSPAVTMSRDMLSYEPGEMDRYPFLSWARMRLILLRYMQNRSLRMSEGVIFLTKYAANVIQESSGTLRNIKYIPHGLGIEFSRVKKKKFWTKKDNTPIQCVYVSPIWAFKHQCSVLDAVYRLRQKGYDIKITFIGGGNSKASAQLARRTMILDPDKVFVEHTGHIKHEDLPKKLGDSDIFIFASSCENLPNTLLEAMAVGLPIACSNRGPMPEVLKDGGVYFNPEKPTEIEDAVGQLINDSKIREELATRAKNLGAQYSWSRCAKETFTFLSQIVHRN